MANSSLIWIRDNMVNEEDFGDYETASNGGTIILDLLYKARAGRSVSQDWPAALPASVQPVSSRQSALGSPDPLAFPPDLPVQDVTGSIVERIRLKFVPYFANRAGDSPNHHTFAVTQGHFEGIICMPMNNVGFRALPSTIGPHPGTVGGSQQFDWLWWDRVHMLNEGYKKWDFANGFGPLSLPTEMGYAHEIDTRCSRRLREQGQTLAYCISFPSAFTCNGWALSWSVLLRLPSA